MYVKDWMSTPVITADPAERLIDARARMMEHDFRRLPVVRAGVVVGIITRRDIDVALGSPWDLSIEDMRDALDRAVAEVMTPNPESVEPHETVRQAALDMLEKRVTCLPVVEEGKIVGILTESDLFRALIELLGIATLQHPDKVS